MATLNVPAPGPHTVNVWMREDGFVFDRLLLTTDPEMIPTGEGPQKVRKKVQKKFRKKRQKKLLGMAPVSAVTASAMRGNLVISVPTIVALVPPPAEMPFVTPAKRARPVVPTVARVRQVTPTKRWMAW